LNNPPYVKANDVPILIKYSIVFGALREDLRDMDILLVGPVLAISAVATLFTGKFMLRGFVAVLERRGRE
jgi:hypothetical protein